MCSSDLGFPGGVVKSPLDGPGLVQTYTQGNPALGAEIVVTVPANTMWLVKSFTARLITSAVVANRTPFLTIDDGANTFYQIGQQNSTASTNTYEEWHSSLGYENIRGTNNEGLPSLLKIKAGYRLRTSTTAIDAGDQWSAIVYNVEEWISP